MSANIDNPTIETNAVTHSEATLELSKPTESAPTSVSDSSTKDGESVFSTKTEMDSKQDESDYPKTVDGFIDYSQIYEQLQEQYNRVYAVSQKLFVTEKVQRQTLQHYKRRLNALSDVLQDLEGVENLDIDEPMKIDHNRIEALVTWRPELAQSLAPVLQIAAEKPFASIPVKRSYAVNLAVDESIPEVINDGLDIVELNPQETDMWVRRNFQHLVVSKFRPADIKARGVREYVDASSNGSKRKKRS